MDTYPRVDIVYNPWHYQQNLIDDYWNRRNQYEREQFLQKTAEEIDHVKYYAKDSIDKLTDQIRESSEITKQKQKEINEERRDIEILNSKMKKENLRELLYLREKVDEIKMKELQKASNRLYFRANPLD
ncbi:unnamed protein product [Moneuplotes crassus]|uniref:Uncharacterized protein n=1 Tax=Euplotes crassus TaxID=5936 RepID=A0AAD1XY94_EUPCR|nr:unnamed protein product [Moneuplotes crassus]